MDVDVNVKDNFVVGTMFCGVRELCILYRNKWLRTSFARMNLRRLINAVQRSFQGYDKRTR